MEKRYAKRKKICFSLFNLVNEYGSRMKMNLEMWLPPWRCGSRKKKLQKTKYTDDGAEKH